MGRLCEVESRNRFKTIKLVRSRERERVSERVRERERERKEGSHGKIGSGRPCACCRRDPAAGQSAVIKILCVLQPRPATRLGKSLIWPGSSGPECRRTRANI